MMANTPQEDGQTSVVAKLRISRTLLDQKQIALANVSFSRCYRCSFSHGKLTVPVGIGGIPRRIGHTKGHMHHGKVLGI